MNLEINKYHLIDVLDGLKTIENESTDIIIIDPPYNIGKDYGVFKDNLPKGEYEKWMMDIATEAQRVSKRGVLVYVGGKLTNLFGKILPDSHLIIVEKRAAGVFSGNYMLQYHSMFSTAPPLIKCKDLWDDVRLPGEGYYFREERFDHPGLTGLEFTTKVLLYFSEEGDTILDPFLGCGTTGVAAIRTGRKIIGTEINPVYFNDAKARIEKEMQQGKLKTWGLLD